MSGEAEQPQEQIEDDGGRFIVLMVLATILVVVALSHQVVGNGALASPGVLLAELHAAPASPDLDRPWEMGEELPYRYRPLYRFLVMSVYAHMEQRSEVFYGLFVTAGALSLLLALVFFDWLLRELGFSSKQALFGMALFALGFPVLFSYDMPIHTREDFLGYAWIAVTLVAVARDRPWIVAGLGAVGAGIRETCLLAVLPYFLVSKRKTQAKVLAYAVPGIAWLAIRFARSLPETYDYVGVSTAPTLEYPLEALLYLFACFGCLWVAAGLRLAQREAPTHPLLHWKVVLLAFVATASTGWTLGMIREARITYILFPFVIGLSLEFFASARFKEMLRSKAACAAAVNVLVIGLMFLAYLHQDPDRVYGLREYFESSFNFGVSPVKLMQLPNGEEVWVEQAYASSMNGPVVLLHLAASAFLGAGWLATRRPSPAPPQALKP